MERSHLLQLNLLRSRLLRLPSLPPLHLDNFLLPSLRTVQNSLLPPPLNRLRLLPMVNLARPLLYSQRNRSSWPTFLLSTLRKLPLDKPNSLLKKLPRMAQLLSLLPLLLPLPTLFLSQVDRLSPLKLRRAKSVRPLLLSFSSPTQMRAPSLLDLRQLANLLFLLLPLLLPRNLSLKLFLQLLGLPPPRQVKLLLLPLPTLSSVRNLSRELVRVRSTSRKTLRHSD